MKKLSASPDMENIPRQGSGAQKDQKRNFQERGTMSFGDKDDDMNDREARDGYVEPSFRQGDQSFQENNSVDFKDFSNVPINESQMNKKPLFNREEKKDLQPSQANPKIPSGFNASDQSFGDKLNDSKLSMKDSPISLGRELALVNQSLEDSFQLYDSRQHLPSVTVQKTSNDSEQFEINMLAAGQDGQRNSTVLGLKDNLEMLGASQMIMKRSRTVSSRKLLIITIKRASKLVNLENLSKSDPFVRVSIFKKNFGTNGVELPPEDKQEFSTKFVNSSLDPIWNQKFTVLHFEEDSLEEEQKKPQYIRFEVLDYEDVKPDKLMGYAEYALQELLNKVRTQNNTRSSDITLKLNADRKNSKVKRDTATQGLLVVQVKMKHLYEKDTAFEVQDPQFLETSLRSASNRDGILKLTLHHFDQLEGSQKPNGKYFIFADAIKTTSQLSMSDGAKQPEQKWLCDREDSFQCQHEFTFKIQSLLETDIMIRVTKKGVLSIGKNERPITRFSISLKNAVELMKGSQPIYIMVDCSNDFSSQTSSLNNNTTPKAFISLQYFNSFFTRFPDGNISLQIAAFHIGPAPWKTNQYVVAKINGEKTAYKFFDTSTQIQLPVKDPLDQIDIKVMEKAVLMDKEIGSHRIHPYEFFKEHEQIVYQNVFQVFSFIDKSSSKEIKISFESRFTLSNMQDEKWLLENGQIRSSIQKSRGKSIDALLRTPSANVPTQGGADSHDASQDKSPLTSTNAGGQGGDEFGKAATSSATVDLDFQDFNNESMSQILEMRRGVMHFRVVFAEMNWFDMSAARIQARTFLKEKLQSSTQLKTKASKNQQKGVTPSTNTSQSDKTASAFVSAGQKKQEERSLALTKGQSRAGGKAGADQTEQDEIEKVLEDPSFFVLIKNSKVVAKTKATQDSLNPQWFEILDFKIIDPKENYIIKLYLDNHIAPFLIAEGQLNSQLVFEKYPCWKKNSFNALLKQVADPQEKEIPLQLDFFYRNSHFTRLPRGKVEVSLAEGHSLTYNDRSFIKPMFVFTLRNQTFQLMEELSNPAAARWTNHRFYFETSSVWDTMEIRIYQPSGQDKDDKLKLLGSHFVSLNSIYYDDKILSTKILKLRDASEALSGQIKLNFEYTPIRKGLESDLKTGDEETDGPQRGEADRLRTGGRLRRLNDETLIAKELMRGVCFMTLKTVKIQNMEKSVLYNVENIRVQVKYQKQKCLSKITTDLNKTGSREDLNDQFRLVIGDISRGENRFDEEKISVSAYDIDYRTKGEVSEIQTLVGNTTIEPYLLRQHQGMEFQYQCSIPLDDHCQVMLKKRPRDDQDKDGGILNFQRQIEDLKSLEAEGLSFLAAYNTKGGAIQNQIALQKKNIKEMVLVFHVVYLSTNFTKSPLGMITINELSLFNLNYFLKSSVINDTGKVYAQFKMNGNKCNTNYAQKGKESFTRKGMCLFHQEYDPIDVMRAGDDYFVDTGAANQSLEWDGRQIVLFTSSPLDQLEIEIILERKAQGSLRLKQGSAMGGVGRGSRKIILANILLNIADISYFMNKSATNEASLAALMDFQNSVEDFEAPGSTSAPLISLSQVESTLERRDGINRMMEIKAARFMNSRDLLGQAFQKQIIALMKIRYQSDVFIEKKQMEDKINIDHLFLIPREVKYDDFIAEGYERIKQQHLSKNTKPQGTQQLGKKAKQEHKHMLAEFRLVQLNSILRDVKSANEYNEIYCFLAFEYLSQNDSVRSYLINSTDYVRKEQVLRIEQDKRVEEQANRKLRGGVDPNESIQSKEEADKRKKNNHGFGHIVDDFISSEELLKVDTQITSIFNVNDFEIHTINEMLEGWVPITTNKIMLSLVVQQNKFSELSAFRNKLLNSVLSKDTTILGIQKSGEGSVYSNVEVYQSPIEFELYPHQDGPGGQLKGAEPTILNSFIQCANLATLALDGQLLMTPIPRAQCLVKTRLQTSNFIDSPSGFLNLALRKMSYNSPNFRTDTFVRITLKSRVSKEKLAHFSNNICDFMQTQVLSTYKITKEERGNKSIVNLNEVSNFLVRHFADYLVISVYQLPKSEFGFPIESETRQPDLIFQTKVELNNLDLNDEKLTIVVVGTHVMKNKGNPVYYTFELDMLFNRRLMSDKGNSSRDLAIANYKLLKGKEVLSSIDEQIIDMLLERTEMGKKLLPNRIRLRKVFFILRNMVKSSYQSVDLEHQSHFRVLPRLFFCDLRDPNVAMSLSDQRQRELLSQIKRELLQGKVKERNIDPSSTGGINTGGAGSGGYFNIDSKYKGLKLEKGSQIEKGNILVIEFLSSIQVAHGGASGMATQRSRLELTQYNSKTQGAAGEGNPQLNQSQISLRSVTGMSFAALMKYKKMVLHVLQGEETISKHSFDRLQLISGDFLKGLRIFVRNVQYGTVLTFRILVEEEKTTVGGGISKSNLPKAGALQRSDTSKLTQLGFTVLDIGAQSLSTWVKVEKTLAISHFSVNVSLNLLYSDFIKNPHKVVNFTFHRLIAIKPWEMVDRGGRPLMEDLGALGSASFKTRNLQNLREQNNTSPMENVTKTQQKDSKAEQLRYNNVVQGKNSRHTERLNALMYSERHDFKFAILEEPIVMRKSDKDNFSSTGMMLSNLNQQLEEGQNPQGNQGATANLNKAYSKAVQGFFGGGQGVKVVHEGSINQTIEKIQSRVVYPDLDVKLKLELEFENCLEYKGQVKDRRTYEMDKVGRRTVPEVEKITINNTDWQNKIVFKLCIDNSQNTKGTANIATSMLGMENPNQVVIAQTSLYLAEVQSLPNQTLNFFIPLKSIAEQTSTLGKILNVSLENALAKYELNNIHILGSIRITDKTFGELSIDLESLKSVPKSLELRELQYRVQVRPNNMQTKELMLLSIQQKQEQSKQQLKEKLRNFQKPGTVKEETKQPQAQGMQGGIKNPETEKAKAQVANLNKPTIEEVKKIELEEKKRQKAELVSTGAPQELKNYDTYSFESPRFEYSINLNSYKLDRNINIPLALKDIFSDIDSFLDLHAADLYKDYDNKLVVQLLGFDENNQQIDLGQIELSMIQMIQRQMLSDSKLNGGVSTFFATKNTNATAGGAKQGTQQFKTQQYEQVAEKKLEKDFIGTSSKFQRLFKESYVRFNETKQIMQQKKDEQLLAKRKEFQDRLSRSPDGRGMGTEADNAKAMPVDMPEGYQLFKFEKPKKEKGEFDDPLSLSLNPNMNRSVNIFNSSAQKSQLVAMTQAAKPENMSDLIAKIEWNFSYQPKKEFSARHIEISEELKQLEMIKQKKNIGNLLDLLTEVKTSSSLIFNNLKRLALVLASESCMSYSTEEELLNCQALQQTIQIVNVLTQLYKESQLKMEALIEIMRSITYLKIICDCNHSYRAIFLSSIKQSLLIETMIETYEMYMLDRKGFLTQRTAGIEFMQFLATMLLDFPDVYFEMISGVRLEPLLKFMNELNKNDFNIVQAYSKFLNAVAQCLFSFKPETYEEEQREKRTQLVKMDIKSISNVIDKALQHLVSGGLTVYKTDHEVITEILCKTAMQFVHLAVVQSKLIDFENFTLSDILLHIFKILIDSIIGKLYLDFITDLKSRLNYEISMIKSLNLTGPLKLMFDDGELMGMMQALAEYFARLMKVYDVDQRQHGLRFFEKTKLIFEFFASEQCMNNFAENMRAKALKSDPKTGLPVRQVNVLSEILTDPSVEDVDFVLFLQKVVKVDAEIESQGEGQTEEDKLLTEAQRRQKEKDRKNRFMTDKYGNIQRTNKFSLTRVGWLDTLYNNDL